MKLSFLFILFISGSIITSGQIMSLEINNYNPDSINQYNENGRFGIFIEACSHPLEDPRLRIGKYLNDEREGLWLVIDSSKRQPKLIAEFIYKRGKLNGMFNLYKKGKLSEQHYFINNKLSNYSHFYSSKGKLITIAEFFENKFIKIIFNSQLKYMNINARDVINRLSTCGIQL